jgi:hypothetical protein
MVLAVLVLVLQSAVLQLLLASANATEARGELDKVITTDNMQSLCP